MTRTPSIALTVTLTALSASPVAAAPWTSSSPHRTEPAPVAPGIAALDGALWGAHVPADGHNGNTEKQAIAHFEAQIGRKISLLRKFYRWDEPWPTAVDLASLDDGRRIILSWSSQRTDDEVTGWRDIASGVHDEEIRERARAIKGLAATVFFTFHHEPENDKRAGGTPADFVAAWRHIHHVWTVEEGVRNVQWTWIMMAWTFYQDLDPDQWFPGRDFVDWVAADGYNWDGCRGHDGPWRSVEEIFGKFHQWSRERAPDKPVMIAEWGSGEDPPFPLPPDPERKANWFREALAWFETVPAIKAIVYFNAAPTISCARWIDTSQNSLAAYREISADPYTNPTPVADIATGPPSPTAARRAHFTFSATWPSGSGTIACRLDGGTASDCSGGRATYFGLSPGDHVFSVMPKDAGGVHGYTNSWRWAISA